MSGPVRIQRRRTKGWKMPENTVYVGRPTATGNFFYVGHRADVIIGDSQCKQIGVTGSRIVRDAAEAVELYRRWWTVNYPHGAHHAPSIAAIRGKNLACWCALCAEHANGKPLNIRCDNCAPCHVDPLGELANSPHNDAV